MKKIISYLLFFIESALVLLKIMNLVLVCMEGLWFLYEDEFFNLESDEASMLWAFGKENFCLNLDPVMDNKISSLKYEVAIYVPVWLAAYDKPGFTGF